MMSLYHRDHPDHRILDHATRKAWISWLAERRLSHFVTLTTNDSCSPRYMVGRLEKWLKRVNRKLLGTRWLQKGDEWMISYFFPEKLRVNSHWHGLVDLVPAHYDRFEQTAELLWVNLVPSGTTDIQRIWDRRKVARYVTKNIRLMENYQHVHVGEFCPAA